MNHRDIETKRQKVKNLKKSKSQKDQKTKGQQVKKDRKTKRQKNKDKKTSTTMRYCSSDVISHEIYNHEIMWFSVISHESATMRYCGLVQYLTNLQP